MKSFIEFLNEQQGNDASVPRSKTEEIINRLEADIEKRKEKVEVLLSKKEASVKKELDKTRKNAEKILKTKYDGVYTEEIKRKEAAEQGYFNWTMSCGLDDKTGTFSWSVWEKHYQKEISDEYDWKINNLKEAIHSKMKELAKYKKRFDEELEKEYKKAEKEQFANKWMKDFPAPEKLRQLLDFLETSYYNLLKEENAADGFYTDEEIRKRAKNYTKFLMIDLSYRISYVTGKLIDCDYIRMEYSNSKPVIVGFFIGEKGKAESKVIIAGGYNIQKLHNRVIVTKK